MNKTRTAPAGQPAATQPRKTLKPDASKDLFETRWSQIRGLTTGWWSLMTESELDKVARADVKYDKYVTFLQIKYGYTREQAHKEIARRMAELSSTH